MSKKRSAVPDRPTVPLDRKFNPSTYVGLRKKQNRTVKAHVAQLNDFFNGRSPPASPSPAPVDDNEIWLEATDPQTGKKYFYNPVTFQTRWTKPGSEGGEHNVVASSTESEESLVAADNKRDAEDPAENIRGGVHVEENTVALSPNVAESGDELIDSTLIAGEENLDDHKKGTPDGMTFASSAVATSVHTAVVDSQEIVNRGSQMEPSDTPSWLKTVLSTNADPNEDVSGTTKAPTTALAEPEIDSSDASSNVVVQTDEGTNPTSDTASDSDGSVEDEATAATTAAAATSASSSAEALSVAVSVDGVAGSEAPGTGVAEPATAIAERDGDSGEKAASGAGGATTSTNDDAMPASVAGDGNGDGAYVNTQSSGTLALSTSHSASFTTLRCPSGYDIDMQLQDSDQDAADAEICEFQMAIETQIIHLEREHELRVNALRMEWRRLQSILDQRINRPAKRPVPPPPPPPEPEPASIPQHNDTPSTADTDVPIQIVAEQSPAPKAPVTDNDAALPSHSGALLSPEALVGRYVHVQDQGAGLVLEHQKGYFGFRRGHLIRFRNGVTVKKMLRQKGTKSGVPFTVLIEPVPEELRTALQERGPTVIKKGVLRKKGKASGKWSQRQFQLSAINLTYSRAFPLGRSKIWAGCWALRDIKEVRVEAEGGGMFSIQLRKKRYRHCMRADTTSEAIEWVAAIEDAMRVCFL